MRRLPAVIFLLFVSSCANWALSSTLQGQVRLLRMMKEDLEKKQQIKQEKDLQRVQDEKDADREQAER